MGSQTWEYNGSSFELDMRDAVQAERYEDAAELLFGGRLNLGEYNDAYYAFLDFIVAQGEAERRRLDEMMEKYSLARIKGREKK